MKTFKLFVETVLAKTHQIYLRDKLRKDIKKDFDEKVKKNKLTDK